MARVTVVSDVRWRRDRSDEERMEILREAFVPGAIVAGVARRYDISRGPIYIWRREAMRRAQSAFAPAVIEDAASLELPCGPAAEPEAAVVLELADGGRLRIWASALPALTAAALRAVR